MFEYVLGIMTGVMTSIAVSVGLYLKNKNKKSKEQSKSKKQLNVSIVKSGQKFKLQHNNALEGTCIGTCITNDTENKKILFSILWENDKKEQHRKQYVLPYDAKEFVNFHILNINEFKIQQDNDEISDNNNNNDLSKQQKIQEEISKLKNILNKHIHKEEYEKAQEIQNKINALNKKLK